MMAEWNLSGRNCPDCGEFNCGHDRRDTYDDEEGLRTCSGCGAPDEDCNLYEMDVLGFRLCYACLLKPELPSALVAAREELLAQEEAS